MSRPRWPAPFAWRMTGDRGPYSYAVGWDRLDTYEDLLLRRRGTGRLSSINLYAERGFWNDELRLLARRGDVSLTVSAFGRGDYAAGGAARGLAIARYRPGGDVHLHVKADLWEDESDPLVRVSTAHLATRRIGPIVLGMRGFGRTELFFSTSHPGVIGEARALVRGLERHELPASGRYLRFEGPTENEIYPAICEDLLRLRPGTGRILHARASFHEHPWKPRAQSVEGLVALHALLRTHARAGGDVLVAYGELTPAALSHLRGCTDAGAHVGLPRYFPGSCRLPYGFVRLCERIPPLRRFKLAEHFNVTIIEGLRDTRAAEPYAAVYFGHKSDIPYDRSTLELMVRLESREFPGLAEAIRRLVESRVRRYDPSGFQAWARRRQRRAARRTPFAWRWQPRT